VDIAMDLKYFMLPLGQENATHIFCGNFKRVLNKNFAKEQENNNHQVNPIK